MPEPNVSFTLDLSTLNILKKAASVFGHNQMVIEPDSGSIKLTVVDPENTTANTYSIILLETLSSSVARLHLCVTF